MINWSQLFTTKDMTWCQRFYFGPHKLPLKSLQSFLFLCVFYSIFKVLSQKSRAEDGNKRFLISFPLCTRPFLVSFFGHHLDAFSRSTQATKSLVNDSFDERMRKEKTNKKSFNLQIRSRIVMRRIQKQATWEEKKLN